MSVWLARHGETPYNAEGRFQGHLPVPLTERGREQARALADAAAQRKWSALWCSTLERARETAAIVGERIGLEPCEDARLAETHTGDWTDRPFDEVLAEDPEGFARFRRADPTFRFPGGESFAEQGERVLACLADVRAGELPALVICHRGVIRVALAGLTGDDAQRERPIANAELVPLP